MTAKVLVKHKNRNWRIYLCLLLCLCFVFVVVVIVSGVPYASDHLLSFPSLWENCLLLVILFC